MDTGTATRASAAPLVTALTLVYVLWGSTYLAARVLVETIPPLLGTGVRFLVAGLVLYPVLWLRRGRGGVAVTRRQFAATALIGLLFLGGGTGLVTVAERDVPSGLAAILVAAMPLVVVLLRRGTGERVSGLTLAGTAIGFAGVVVLLSPGSVPAGVPFPALLLVLVAAVSLAVATVAGGRLPLPDTLLSTALELLVAGVACTALGLALGERADLDAGAVSGRSLVSLVYLIVAGSLVAYTAYVWLLGHASPSLIATYTYVNPVVAIALGWLILNEEVTRATLVGAALIVGSVAMVARRDH